MLTAALIQLYWLSFSIIGVAALLWVKKSLPQNSLIVFLRRAHVLTALLIAEAIGFAFFIVPVTLAYIFEVQVLYLVVLYLSILAGSFGVIAWQRKALRFDTRTRTRKFTKPQLITIGLVGGALGFDYALSLHTGSTILGDAALHLAKIQLTLNSHMTLADPHVGYSGILDMRYSANLMNAFQAMGAKLTGVWAKTMWFSSLAFYRLVMWLSLFSLAWEFLPKRAPRQWAYLVPIVSPFVYTGYFFSQAELPHCIVMAWACLLLIGLKQLLQKESAYLFMLATSLIAVSHAVSSLTTMVFLGMLLCGLALAKKLTKIVGLSIGVALLILAVPVAANSFSPSRSTEYHGSSSAGDGLHLQVKTNQYGPIVVPRPNFSIDQRYSIIDLPFFGVTILLAGYLVFLKRLQKPLLKKLCLWTVCLAGLAVFNVIYASLVGYFFLVRYTKNQLVRVMLILCIVYYGLIIYNPVILTLALGRLPLWFLARFQDFNMFAYITPIIGVVVVYDYIAAYWKLPELSKNYSIIILIGLALLSPLHKFPVDTKRISTFGKLDYKLNKVDYAQIDKLRLLDPYVKDQVIFSNDPWVISFMGAATKSKQMGMVDNTMSNQAKNLAMRTKCQQQLFQTLTLADLRAAKVSSVVLIPGHNDGLPYFEDDFTFKGKEPYELADSLPYLQFQKQVGKRRIYAVIPNNTSPIDTASVCAVPYGQ